MLQSMRSQRVRHDWVTKLNWDTTVIFPLMKQNQPSCKKAFIKKHFEYALGELLLHADNKYNLSFTEAFTFSWAYLPNSAHYLQHVWFHTHQHIHFTAPSHKLHSANFQPIFLFVHQTHQGTNNLWENYSPPHNSFRQSIVSKELSVESFIQSHAHEFYALLPLHLLLSPTLWLISLFVLKFWNKVKDKNKSIQDCRKTMMGQSK